MATVDKNYEDYEIFMKTVKVNKFKQLIEALKEILLDVNLDFSPNGIRIASVNVTETVLVSLKLTPDIGDFYCEQPRSLGINMGRFHQIIKTLNNNDMLSIFVEKADRNVLVVFIENKAKHEVRMYLIVINLYQISQKLQYRAFLLCIKD